MSFHTLHIVHTNDIHSFFGQMPKVYTVINDIRSAHSQDETLILDIGDHMDRMRVETEGTSGLANIDIMNQTGYELQVLGNNEGLTFSPELISEVYKRHAQFEVIGSNIIDLNTCEMPDWLIPYKIIRKGPMTIGIIGVTIDFNAFYELLGWYIRDPFEVTKELVAKLRPACDLILVMSHLGLGHDRVMAETIDGIDIIMGGHTHHLLEQPLYINQTCIVGAGKFGQHVGEVIVDYDEVQRRVTRIDGRCIDVQPYKSNAMIEELIAHHQRQAARELEQVVTHIEKPFLVSWTNESTLGNLLASGIREWTGTQLSLVNAGQNLDSLAPGVVTKKRLLEICPSPINPCKMVLTGSQIKQALEESLLGEFIHKPIRGFGFRGVELGTLCVDGISIHFDAQAEPYNKIKDIRLDGMPLKMTTEYSVGTLDMFSFGIGYTSIRDGKDIQFFLPEFIRDVLALQLQRASAINNSMLRRWHPNDR